MKLTTLLVMMAVSSGLAIAADPTAGTNGGQDKAQAILAATDPSAAVAAYTQAIAANPNDPAAYRAYVRKMVDFAMPQSAFLQAQTLVKLDPRSGLGWAVVANWSATQNDYRSALSNIRRAVDFLPNDPYVMRVAAQIIGWYDSNYKYADLPREYRLVLSQVGQKMQDKPIYTQTYQSAMIEFANAKAGITDTTTKVACPVIVSNAYGPSYQKPAVVSPTASAMLPIPQVIQPVYPTSFVQSIPSQYVQPPVAPSLSAGWGLAVPFSVLPTTTVIRTN